MSNWGHQLIKHKKTSVLKVKDDVQGELLLDHNFNPSTAIIIVRMMKDIKEHLLKVCSPLQDQVVLKNILTGEIVTNVAVDKLLCCITGVMLLMLNLSMINSEKMFQYTQLQIKSTKMPLNLNSKADMKGEVVKGLRMGITGVHH